MILRSRRHLLGGARAWVETRQRRPSAARRPRAARCAGCGRGLGRRLGGLGGVEHVLLADPAADAGARERREVDAVLGRELAHQRGDVGGASSRSAGRGRAGAAALRRGGSGAARGGAWAAGAWGGRLPGAASARRGRRRRGLAAGCGLLRCRGRPAPGAVLACEPARLPRPARCAPDRAAADDGQVARRPARSRPPGPGSW